MINEKESAVNFAETRYKEAKQKETDLINKLRNLYAEQANLSTKSGDFNDHRYKTQVNVNIKKTVELIIKAQQELLIPIADIVDGINAS